MRPLWGALNPHYQKVEETKVETDQTHPPFQWVHYGESQGKSQGFFAPHKPCGM
jgi:hypothetical protein